jgi:thioredoxin 1
MLRKLFGRPQPPAPEQQPAGAPRILPIDVTDADFAAVVAASDKLAVVDFWADWCEPCRPMSAYVAFLAADYDGRLLVTALDVDENPATAEQYQVMGLPTLLFLRGGTEVARVVGLVAYDDLKRQVEQLLADKPN